MSGLQGSAEYVCVTRSLALSVGSVALRFGGCGNGSLESAWGGQKTMGMESIWIWV